MDYSQWIGLVLLLVVIGLVLKIGIYRVRCSWCKNDFGWGFGMWGVSDGCCPACEPEVRQQFMAEIKAFVRSKGIVTWEN